jgi:polysaccharide biosynthesis/export protein
VRQLLILWSLAIGLAACASQQAFEYEREPDPRREEFVIGVGDTLRINIWRMPDLSVDAKVRPDGTVTMPLIGDLKAAGRSPKALCAEIENALKEFIKDDSAKVTVAVSDVSSYYFTVLGNAERQGLFSANHYMTITEAIAQAGGPSRFASPSKTVLIRQSPSGPRRIPIDLDAIYSGKRPEMNLVIVSGDTLYLP